MNVIVVGIADNHLQEIIANVEGRPECKSLKKIYTSFQFFKEYSAGEADIIFIDTSIPDTDIRPFAKRIREIDSKVKLIGVAKHKDHIMIRQFKEIDNSDFILKTDSTDEFLDKLFSGVKKKEKKDYVGLENNKNGKGNTILVVDDFENTLDVIKYTLELAGFKVLTALSGRQALGILNKKEHNIDLLVTDLNMPQMNGFEVIEKTREIEQYKGLPIFILTTEFDMDKKIRAKRLNITGWIQKPYNITDFVEIIKKALS
ncbi:MAG: response regulator [Bacteroidota bacterium]|nr:response regulator [Bacteroidota bacterium]